MNNVMFPMLIAMASQTMQMRPIFCTVVIVIMSQTF